MTRKVVLGTCQCCFNQQVVHGAPESHDTRWLVLHGYERPGHGWLNGQCQGVGKLPYELSCEFTKEWASSVKQMLAGMEDQLADIVADKPDTYSIAVTDYSKWVDREHPIKLVDIPRGFDGTVEHYGRTTFERVRQLKQREKEGDIGQAKMLLAFLAEKVAQWKFAPEALKDRDVLRQEKARATAEQKAAKKAAKEAEAKRKAERPVSKKQFKMLQEVIQAGGGSVFKGFELHMMASGLQDRGFVRSDWIRVPGAVRSDKTSVVITDAGRAAYERQK